jgi:hypothetical protein
VISKKTLQRETKKQQKNGQKKTKANERIKTREKKGKKRSKITPPSNGWRRIEEKALTATHDVCCERINNCC